MNHFRKCSRLSFVFGTTFFPALSIDFDCIQAQHRLTKLHMVRNDRFPSNIARKGEYTVWVRLPESSMDAYVVRPTPRLKMKA